MRDRDWPFLYYYYYYYYYYYAAFNAPYVGHKADESQDGRVFFSVVGCT